MHETPPLRVARPVSACARCRSAKIKCDGKLPACTACEKAGKTTECSSGSDQFARGKERSYVASLETKIERLERQLQYRRNASNSAIGTQRRIPVKNVPNESRVSRKDEASDILELVSDFGYLAVSATSNGYHGFDQEMSLARLVFSIATLSGLPGAENFPLPPRVEALDLFQACVVDFFAIHPIMSFAAAGGALERVYHHQSNQLSSPQDVWNVRMMLALGLSVRSKSKGDVHYEKAIRHVAVAIRTVGHLVIAPGSLARLEGLLLLVLYSTVDPTNFDSWTLMGMAARFMIEMGLHTTSSVQEDMNSSQVENRRRLFSLVYSLDRFISFSRLQPFTYSDDSVDLELPTLLTPSDIRGNESLDSSASEDSAKTFTLLTQCQSRWYCLLYFSKQESMTEPWTSRASLLKENLDWITKIPPAIKGPFRARFLLQIYYFSILLVLPSSSRTAEISAYAKAVTLELIANYVEALLEIIGVIEYHRSSRMDDYLRSIIISQRLLTICNDSNSAVYIAPVPDGDELDQHHLLPALKWTSQGSNVDRTISLIRKLDSSLAQLSALYNQSTSYKSWKLESDNVLRVLYGSIQSSLAGTW